MKKVFLLLFLGISMAAFSQVITEEELHLMVDNAKRNCVGAHESIVLQTNEELAKSIWGKKVRLNETKIIKFFNYPAGEKVGGGVDIYRNTQKNWSYFCDPNAEATLLAENGVRVTQSYNKPWINARQDLLLAENTRDGNKIILELYCPREEFLKVLRIGQTQSIEFIMTGYWAGGTSNDKITGVLTQVNTEKQTIKCSNGHEFDKNMGYKFCPTCGEPLK